MFVCIFEQLYWDTAGKTKNKVIQETKNKIEEVKKSLNDLSIRL